MELDQVLAAFDRCGANVAKLEMVWDRAREFMPSGPSAGRPPEYDDLCRSWEDLTEALPAIDGFRITDGLPDIDSVGRSFIDYFEIGEHPFALYDQLEQPERDLGEYRYRLGRARRRAVRSRLEELAGMVTGYVDAVITHIDETDSEPSASVDHPAADQVRDAVDEIERLIGDSVDRRGKWSDLHRHLRFSQPHDWLDIQLRDWPSVLEDIEAAGFADTDPLPIDGIEDLGVAASGELSGSATVRLSWDSIDDADFERVLYDLLCAFPEHHNVRWLTKTNAPDRGRDLSLDREVRTPTGETKFERVMVQAKHWRAKSVSLDDLSKVVAQSETWNPPFRVVVVATSGRFTNDAVAWAESRSATGKRPDVELLAEPDLERLLARFPTITANHKLR